MAVDLHAAANIEWAAAALERLTHTDPEVMELLGADEQLARRFVVVTGASLALGELLAADTSLLQVLQEDPDAQTAAVVRARAVEAVQQATQDSEGAPDDATIAETLASVQREGVLRIAARDMLGLSDTRATAHELADLADGLIEAAHELLSDRPAHADADLVVIAMGKLGGQELNYVSDVDVIFVHDGDHEAAGRLAKSVLHVLGSHTPRGVVYEMDANLRPEGRNGPLTRTVDSYATYYQRWAKTWEFQSLLKARQVAGPVSLGDRFSEMAAGHVWPTSLGADAVEEIQQMKHRVERSRPVTKAGHRQLKLAPGGLRDIEFATQLLQLVHGTGDRSLRVRGTVPALSALAHGGYIDEGHAALFTDAYLFLRTVEHRLQLRQLRRTHTIPDDPAEFQRLARTMGFRDLPVHTAADAFDKELTRVRSGVRRLHEQLFYRPLLGTLASYGPEHRAGEGARFDEEAARARLHALAFTNPGAALRNLQALVQGNDRTAKQLRVVLPTMLEALADQPDPDGGLAALRTLTEQLRDNPRFIRTIRDNPPAARLLARVLGASPRLGPWLGRQPEVLDLLDDEDELAKARSREELVGGARGLVRRGGGTVSRRALRRFKRREALRAALRDVTGQADLPQTAQELTWLGEGLLHAALTSVLPDEARVAIIGMGRFGAGELAHASDLDVLFVHDGPTPVAEHAMEDLLAFLSEVTPEGSAFRVDPELRPEGRKGPLSRTLESYEAYWERWGEPWEFQALTQARPVAGDTELGAAFVELAHRYVYPDPLPQERLVAIRRMKARVERERAGRRGVQPTHRTTRRRGSPGVRRGGRSDARGAGLSPGGGGRPGASDLKLGPGGLSDVEWTVQLLTIIGGSSDPAVRGPGTLAGLERLRTAGLLTEEEAAWLRSGWLLLSQIRNSLYLIGERDTSNMPRNHDVLRKLALMTHHETTGSLAEEVDRARRRIRKVFDRRFFD